MPQRVSPSITSEQVLLSKTPLEHRAFLRWTLPSPSRSLSWALTGGGDRIVEQVCWIQVSGADLPMDICPRLFLQEQLIAADTADAVGLMTSAWIHRYRRISVRVGAAHAIAIATVGLGNALRAGDPVHAAPRVGTINCACWINQTLSFEALLEALLITGEAKTAAVIEAGIHSLVSQQPATGTGTDCHLIASACGGSILPYAGKHTEAGSAIGAAVYAAVASGIELWKIAYPQHRVLGTIDDRSKHSADIFQGSNLSVNSQWTLNRS